MIDPYEEFQKFKTHTKITAILEGGKMIKYGAKSINAGGYYTMPRLYADGVLLVGDCASFLNGQRIKGIHTAMKSGMLAAETIVDAFGHDDFTSKTLKNYEDHVKMSWIYDELYAVRNFHGAFQKGRWSALVNTGLQFLTGGLAWGFMPKEHHVPGYERMGQLSNNEKRKTENGSRYSGLAFDKELTFDKVTDVFYGAVAHDEDQP